MTKDVELHTSRWSRMRGALNSLTGSVSNTTTYDSCDIYYSGGYRLDEYIEDLVNISERAKKLIKDKDSDGVVSYSYHDDRLTAISLQDSLEKLEQYSSNVGTYLKDKIDQPFYEAMDKVGAQLEALSISNYKAGNTVGFKRTEPILDGYGRQIGTREVEPDSITISELYQVESPYRTALQESYEQFKSSDAYKEHKLSQDEYLMAAHHTRAFSYESIDDQKSNTEMWRDLALSAGVIVLTIFCPPAGITAGVALAGAEMYSAVSGKDWGTGRELDDGERYLRGAFALVDLVPGLWYVGKVAKTGIVKGGKAALALVNNSVKTGLAKGAKHLASFKRIPQYLGEFGDHVLKQIDNVFKQGDQLLRKGYAFATGSTNPNFAKHNARVFTPLLDDGLEASTKFTLNGVDSGAIATTRVERLKAFANGNSSFEDVLPDFVDEYVDAVNSNKPWSWDSDIPNGGRLSKGQRAKVKNAAFDSGRLPKITITPVEGMKFGFADFKGAGLVEKTVDLPKDLWLKSDAEQFKWLDAQIGGTRSGMTWHHTEIPGRMELVPTGIHNIITHNGGRSPGMWAYAPR